MNCDQAFALISAEIDHEIQPADQVRLRDHLGQCDTCRALADAIHIQDAELRRSFVHRRRAAAANAERVVARLASHGLPPARVKPPVAAPPVGTSRLRRYFGWTLAATILLGIGFGLYRLRPPAITSPSPAPRDDFSMSA